DCWWKAGVVRQTDEEGLFLCVFCARFTGTKNTAFETKSDCWWKAGEVRQTDEEGLLYVFLGPASRAQKTRLLKPSQIVGGKRGRLGK
ncbi:MAG: hypothetical protein RBT75_06095, partial [Anaerolineae bacterium]|nr:hypothetical protein [Anaerolineae bacterium]